MLHSESLRKSESSEIAPSIMAFVSDDLLKRLLALTNDTPAARWLVAYSGGIDSTVLLHALAKASHNIPILAIHIDHGLDPSS